MTHDSAVRTIVSLAPEIEKSGASSALTRYAEREDLPPRQLEKLAQVYNTLLQVSHIDNADASADERGKSVDILDVPELVTTYATGLGKAAAAVAPKSTQSHDVRTVDLQRAVQWELTGHTKAAAQATAPAPEAESAVKIALSRAEYEDALIDLEMDLRLGMSKIASELFAAAPRMPGSHWERDISEFESEALRRRPAAAVKAAAEHLEQFAAAQHTRLVRHDYSEALVKYAYDIPHENGEKMAELARLVGMHALVKAAADGDEEANNDLRAALEAGPDEDMVFTMPEPMGGGSREPAPGQEGAATDALLQELANQELATATAQTGATGRTSPDRSDDSDKKDKGSQKDDSGGSKGGKVGPGVLDALAAPFAAVGAGVQGAAQKADEMLSRIVSKERQNKAQRSADLSVEDIKRSMAVHRLIGTDPVLREANPREVLEIYNAIAARNPEVAGDMSALRLLLREAVSYEGLTLDSQKLLSEIRRNSAQGEKESEENSRRRYAVGGANPISISNTSK